MTAVEDLLTGTPPKKETRRDRWGRYLVVPPDGGKPVGYTRATTIAKALDDTSSLMKWGERMTALGLAGRPDLLALVQAADPTDKDTLNGVCERAKEAGGATARRDLGTALHAMLEKHWTDASFTVPEAYAGDVRAVSQALIANGFEVVEGMHERIVVLDRHRIAGTFDLILRHGTDLLVADIKTGSSVAYSALSFATQLSIYAHADALYRQGEATDGSQDHRSPMPRVSRTHAVIIHVEPGSGVCELHQLDLDWALVELALEVREARKAGRSLLTRWATPTVSTTPAGVPDDPFAGLPDPDGKPMLVSDEVMAHIGERVEAIKANTAAVADLVQEWPSDVPTPKQVNGAYTRRQADTVKALLVDVEARHGLTFPPSPDPDVVPVDHDLRDRVAVLPPDIAGEVATGLAEAGLDLRRLTADELAHAEPIVRMGEATHADRLTEAYALADRLAEGGWEWTVNDRLTADQLHVVYAVAKAFTADLIHPNGAHSVALDALVERHGNKRTARAAAAAVAKAHGMDIPSRFDDLADHPILVALTLEATPTINQGAVNQ